jgi:hypothetical protein
MIPRHAHSLRDIAIKLAMSVAPETTSVYVASNTGMISMLLQCLAQDFDRAAESRVRDIAEMKQLFQRALADVSDGELAARLRAYLSTEPKSFTLTDLDAVSAQGQVALIALQTWAEGTGNCAMDHDIWVFLERFADRHAFQLGGI